MAQSMLPLVVSLVFIGSSSAIPWPEPMATPEPLIQQKAEVMRTITADVNTIGPRADAYPASFCGWIAGVASQPALCSSQSSCVSHTDYSVVGCCAVSSNHCAFYTSCVDLKSLQPTKDKTEVLTCRGTSVCYVNTYQGGFTQFGCGASTWATTVLASPLGVKDPRTLQVAVTGTGTASAPSSTSTPSGSTSARKFVRAESASPTTPSPTATDSSDPSASMSSNPLASDDSRMSRPLGALVGGVIGGVAAIGLIALGAFFVIRSRRRRSKLRELTPSPYIAELETPKAQDTSFGAWSALPAPGQSATSPPMNQSQPPRQPNPTFELP